MTIEICVDSFEQALCAQDNRAGRIELCSALELGGLTPSMGLVSRCSQLGSIEVHVLIRPRAGGFNYTNDELELIKLEIISSGKSGATGVVLGILDKNGDLDYKCNYELNMKAKSLGLQTTFHRAFDFVSNPFDTLDQLVDIGFDRLLTSGQQPAAIEGIETLKELVKYAQGKIEIMAGSGINAGNVNQILSAGVDAIHFTARKPKVPLMKMNMGQEFEADEEKIQSIIEQIRKN